MKPVRFLSACATGAFLLWALAGHLAASGSTANGSITLAALDAAYTQNFDTLASSGSNVALTLTGWAIDENGTSAAADGRYSAGTGSGTAGDVYSFGSSGSTDRAFGTLLSGTNTPTIGASFTNNTGATITSIDVSYIGEQWRLGASARGTDRLDFQYSVTATGLVAGTYVDVDALDFSSPITAGTVGALDGNAAANRRTLTATISGLSIPQGATFWIRWTDFNVASSDDGLAVDNFSLTPHGSTGPVTTNPSVSPVATPTSGAAAEQIRFTATLTAGQNPTSTGMAVTIDLGPIGGSNTQVLYDDGTHGDATQGDGVFSILWPIAPGTPTGLKTLAATVTDLESRTGTANVSITVVPTPTVIAIHDVQGSGNTSPIAVGTTVTVEGIVTGVKTNGFFIQAPDAEGDGNPGTSEGVFVFTSSRPPAAAAVSNRVRVTGRVSEFKSTATDPEGVSMTELTSPSVALLTLGNDLPPYVTLTSAELNAAASPFALERFEGMRVHVDTVITTSPTGGTVDEVNASSSSNGLFWGVVPGTARPFREPGIETPLPVPAEAAPGATPPVWDGNHERIGIDTDAIASTPGEFDSPRPPGTTLDVTTGVTVTNVTGPLDYSFRSYIVDSERWNKPAAITANASAIPVREPHADEFTVATFNLERFYDTSADPTTSDTVLTAAAFDRRLTKASLAIRTVLLMPDVIGVEEMEHLSTLQALATRINTDSLAAGTGNPGYVAYLSEGNDIGGIDSGFLVRSDRVIVDSVTQYGKDTTYAEPQPGGNPAAILNDRPPLVLRAHIITPDGPYAFTVIGNHLRSLSGVDGSDGLRIRTKRRLQAEDLASLIQSFQSGPTAERIISVGDYNAFDVNDGYVDVMSTVKGTPTPASQVTQASADLVNPDLVDLVSLAPADQRYSFMFDGNAQELDHILASTGAANRLFINGVNWGRMDADFPEIYRNDAGRPERISDHDPMVGYFAVPGLDVTPPTVTVPASFSREGDTLGGAFVTFAASAVDGIDGSIDPVCSPVSGTLFGVGNTLVTCIATDAHGNVGAASFTVTVTDTVSPTLTLPGSLTAEATGPSGAAVVFSVSATDVVSGALTPTCSATPGSVFPLGDTIVTCTVADGAGNPASGSFTVSVVDTTAPELTVPAPIVAEATSAAGAVVVYTTTATDLVDGTTAVSCTPASGSIFALGTTTVDCSTSDAHANVALNSFTVTVRDTTPPAIVSVTPSQASLWPPNGTMTPVTLSVVATDAVGVTGCVITGVTGNDGATAADWSFSGLTVTLAARRTGGGNGRTYAIEVACTDVAGHSTPATATVVVPHDQRK